MTDTPEQLKEYELEERIFRSEHMCKNLLLRVQHHAKLINELDGAGPTCEWIKDSDYVWRSECGDFWQFSGHHGPIDNSMRFCTFCGKELIEGKEDEQ
jgi:hypothetical protein